MDVRIYKSKFTGKAAVSVLLTLAAALALWLFIAANHRRGAVEDIKKSLLLIHSYKTAQISAWHEGHSREALRFSRHPIFGAILLEEMARPGSRRAELTSWLKEHLIQKQYSSLAFLSPKGAVIAATPAYVRGTEKHFTETFAKAAQTGTASLTDLYLDAGGRPRMTMISPIPAGGREGKTAGLLVINIDPEIKFYPLLKAAPLFFASAETLLVRKEGNQALFLNPLDYRKDSALKFALPLPEGRLPAATALSGDEGFFAGADYRRVKVFGALGRIPGTNWLLVTKVDRDTILAPVKEREHLALAMILLAAVILYALFYIALLRTERASREIIREGERRLAALFSSLPGTAYRSVNPGNWTINFLSEGCLGLTGYRPEELLTGNLPGFFELIIPEDRERVRQILQAGPGEGRRYELTYSLKCKDGSVKTVWEQGLAVGGVYGKAAALEGFISDITPLRRAETALKVGEQIFREFLEHSPIYVFFKDENIRPIHLSRNYETLIGKPLGEILGRSMDELFPSDLAKSMVADDLRILKEGKEITVEEEFNGRSYRTVKFPIKLEGKPPYLAGFTLDITEQKRAAQALRESEERLRVTLEETRIGTWDWDVVNDTWHASPTYSTMLGYEPEPGPSDRKVWLERAHPEDREMVAQKIRGVLLGNDAKYQYEARLRHADGAYRWVSVLGNTVKRDKNGKPARIIGVRIDITERKQAEEQLRESETRYRALIDASGDGILTADLETMKFRFANRAICRMFGYTPEELTALSVTDIHPKEALPAVIAEFEAQARGERTLAPNLPCLRKDGSVFYADITTTPATVDGRRCNLGIFRDITERRRTEEALQESAAKLELTIDEAPVCVAMVGTDKRFIKCNKAFTAFLGYSEEEMKGKTIRDITFPEDAEIGMPEIQAILAGESKGVTLQKRYVRKDGAVVWGEATIKLIRNARGEPLYLLPIIQDITARKLAEEEIRRTLDMTPALICVAKPDGYFEKVNPEWERVLGFSEKELMDTGYAKLIHPDDIEPTMAEVRKQVGGGRTMNFTNRYRHKDGTYRLLEWNAVPASDGRLYAAARDVTERRKAELERERLNRDLVAKRQEMENFLYITTHDLRTPLVNVQGFAQNIERYLRELVEELSPARLRQPVNEAVSKLTGKEIPEALNFVLESSHKMDSLISSLLKVARLGRVEMKSRNLEMNDLLKKIVDSTFYQLEEAGAAAKVGILPPCKADPEAVSQIFANLLENAIKYRSGDRPLAISITGEARGASVFYKVADNGSGIPAKDLGRIWDIFYRGAGAGQGEGIGLTVVKYMVEKNGGSAKAESKEGQGTVFYIELPAAGGTK